MYREKGGETGWEPIVCGSRTGQIKNNFSNYWVVQIILIGIEGVQGVAGGWAWIDTQGVFGARPPWASWPPMHHHASTPAPSMPLQRHQHQTNTSTSAASATIYGRATIITWSTGISLTLSLAVFQVNPILSERKKQNYDRYIVLYIVWQIHTWINLRQDAISWTPKLISANPAFISHTADATAAQPILATYS